VTGSVKLKLFKGGGRVVSRKSRFSLYDADLATFGEGGDFNQRDAEGFIRLFGLPLRSTPATNGDAAASETAAVDDLLKEIARIR
jgi:argininosuccinate synthase